MAIDALRELTEYRVKAEEDGWLPEFEAIIKVLIAAQERAEQRLAVLGAIGRLVGWETPTPEQLSHLPQAVASLKARADRAGSPGTEFLHGWVAGYLEAIGAATGAEFSSAEGAVRHLAGLYREALKCEKRNAEAKGEEGATEDA